MAIDDGMRRTNAELRYDARAQLEGDWAQAVLTCLVYSVIMGAAAGVAGVGNLIVGGPMDLGLAAYFLLLKRSGSAQLEDVFRGFNSFENSLIVYIVRTVYIILWSLLLIVPGIIAALRYSMALYILHDSPGLSGMEALNQSKELMAGYEGKLFMLYLSFVGWAVLCAFTLGIGFLWLMPYMKASEANFYEDIRVV